MAEQDPQELARALEREADDLARQGREVEDAVKGAHEDWQRKRRDENVPGAPPPDRDEEDEPSTADDA